MPTNRREPLSYWLCQNLVAQGRVKGQKKLCGNVYLHESSYNDVYSYTVRLHGNTILWFHQGGRVQMFASRRSVTTKRMLNRFAPAGADHVYQRKHVWYYGGVEFQDGMEVGMVKQCHNCGAEGMDGEIAWVPALQLCGPCRDRVEDGEKLGVDTTR